MSHRFRFSDSALDRVKDYCQKLAGKGKGGGEKKSAVQPPQLEEEQPKTVQEGESSMIVVSRTDIGKVRRSNQDAVIQSDGLYGVADGMGGHNGGEVASASARELLMELLDGKEPDPDALRTAITAVNRRLFLRQQEEESLSGMGTTLTVLWVAGKVVHIGHVGDSRAYRLRDGELTQLTRDHSVVAEMVREGLLTPAQAACHPMRNVITRAVGTEDGVEVDLYEEERRKGDLYLVCSDGLYGMVPDKDMQHILMKNPPERAADKLLKAALDAGGRDNVSLVLLLDREGA